MALNLATEISNLNRTRVLLRRLSADRVFLNGVEENWTANLRVLLEEELIQLLSNEDVNSTIRTFDNVEFPFLNYYLEFAHALSINVLERFYARGADFNRNIGHGSPIRNALSRSRANGNTVIEFLLNHDGDPTQELFPILDRAVQSYGDNYVRRSQILTTILSAQSIVINRDFIYTLLGRPDVIFEILRPANATIQNVMQNCRDLHLDINWNAAGQKKLDLFILLIDVFNLNINEQQLLFSMANLDDSICEFISNHHTLDLNFEFVDNLGVTWTPVGKAIQDGQYQLLVKFVKAGFRLLPLDDAHRATLGANAVQIAKLITKQGLEYSDFYFNDEGDFEDPDVWQVVQDILAEIAVEIPERRGTLMELATIKLRNLIGHDGIAQQVEEGAIPGNNNIFQFFSEDPFEN